MDDGDREALSLKRMLITGWLPMEAATPEVWEIAKAMLAPKPGQHIGKTTSLSDGKWLVVCFSNSYPGKPEFFCVLDEPSHHRQSPELLVPPYGAFDTAL